ncbi:MAG: glycosyltransferase family 4 protein [Marinicaulis sp.]|nr:glycosyltransferase family 4 protein [Marinicaulis sp.]
MVSFPHTVLQVVPALNAGGAERTTADIAQAVVAAGGRALIASSGGFLENEIVKNGGEIFTGSYDAKDPISLWKNARRLCEIISENEVEIIHARSRAPAWSAYIAARNSSIPFVTTHHRGFALAGPFKNFYNSSLLRGDLVIANSAFTANAIRASNAINPAKLRSISRGVDLAAFDPDTVSPDRIRAVFASWGVPGDDVGGEGESSLRMLLPARLTRWKGHKAAIQAIAANKSQMRAGNMPKLTLVFCGGAQGGSSYETSLRALVEKRGVREMVHFVGECADMPAAYGWADVVLSPSVKPEPFGRAPIEAGAMKKPVIAFDHGGVRETVAHGVTGILVEPGNEGAFARALFDFAAMSSSDRIEMGARARGRVTERYSVAKMVEATLDAYRDVIAGRNY